MSRDPFDRLRDHNPIRPEEEPSPPMALAERIIGRRSGAGRRVLPGWALAAVAAALVMVVGGTALWLARPPADPGFADGGTTPAPSDTSLPSDTTSTTLAPSDPVDEPDLVEMEAVAYFFAEQTGWRAGHFLIPVAVTVQTRDGDDAGTAAGIAHGALGRLFDLSDVSLYGFSSAIPPDAEYLGLEYDEGTGVVTVFVSAEFAEGGGTFSMHGRLAQVVYTATAVDGVSGVRFEVDGEPTTVFGGDGVVVGDPAIRDEFDAFLPDILIESPAFGAAAKNPLVAWGTADVYEATVSASLRDEDGNLLWEGFTTATCGSGCRGDWEIEIPYEVGHSQWGTLSVWEDSAEDGSVLNLRMHTVWLVPVGTDTTPTTLPPMDCSARDWETPLMDLYGLPAAVAETRRAIWDAATTCDWDALAALLPDEFGFSFGHPEEGSHAIRYWQDLEGSGDNPMFYLAELLTTPYTIVGDAEFPYYVWPVLFGAADDLDVRGVVEDMIRPGELDDDEDLTEAERLARARAMEEEVERVREAVIRLLLRLEQAPYWLSQEAEYSGYRVGIAADGTWRFFIAGD